MRLAILLLTAALTLAPRLAAAQGAEVAFGGVKQDPTLPVEITADSLSVNQTDGTAVFEGNVLAVQGDLRLAAAKVQVAYQDGGTGIETLHATGGVTLVSATDAAEAGEAVYTIASGAMVMTGNVLLTQGKNAISGQKLVLDMKAGTGRMEGRVQTVLTPAPKSETPRTPAEGTDN